MVEHPAWGTPFYVLAWKESQKGYKTYVINPIWNVNKPEAWSQIISSSLFIYFD